jgi:Pentapeptide repeats (8 copies)
VPLIGASGSGKSSVVRAGLIPRLEDLGWRILPVIKPGTEPMVTLQALTADLPADDRSTLLVVDQFEEVFTLCRDRVEQAKFIEALRDLGRVTVVVTMRADFVDACLADEGLTQAIQNHAIWLGAITEAGLRLVIEQPAIIQGRILEAGLSELMLRDVEEEQNCLPLLEFTLTELWERSVDGKLSLNAYKYLGRVAGAMNSHAEKLYHQLAKQKREQWVKPIMLKVVNIQYNARSTRQRQRRSDILAITRNNIEKDSINLVIETLVDGRILVSDHVDGDDIIDLSHEALTQFWERFVTWQREAAKIKPLIEIIEASYRKWDANEQAQDYLLDDKVLEDISPISKEAHMDFLEFQYFILLSRRARIDRLKAEIRQAKIERFLVFISLPLLMAVIFGEYVWKEETVKNDYQKIVQLSGSDQEKRKSVVNLTAGCMEPERAENSVAKFSFENPVTKFFSEFSNSISNRIPHFENSLDKNIKPLKKYVKERIQGNCRSLGNTKLEEADLVALRLGGVSLKNASMRGANLSSANLSRVDLELANLSNANLWSADLSGTNLSSANLSNANLQNIKWSKETNWQGIQGWETVENIPPALKQQLGLKDTKN